MLNAGIVEFQATYAAAPSALQSRTPPRSRDPSAPFADRTRSPLASDRRQGTAEGVTSFPRWVRWWTGPLVTLGRPAPGAPAIYSRSHVLEQGPRQRDPQFHERGKDDMAEVLIALEEKGTSGDDRGAGSAPIKSRLPGDILGDTRSVPRRPRRPAASGRELRPARPYITGRTRTGRDKTDCLAKVGVAGSDPVVRSKFGRARFVWIREQPQATRASLGQSCARRPDAVSCA